MKNQNYRGMKVPKKIKVNKKLSWM